jgi:hypothetical protein
MDAQLFASAVPSKFAFGEEKQIWSPKILLSTSVFVRW